MRSFRVVAISPGASESGILRLHSTPPEIPVTIAPQQTALPLFAVDRIRSQFTALERRENGQPVAYFDGPGGTQVPEPVIEAMVDYLRHHNANTHWAYPTSRETDAAIAQARTALADFLGADPAEVVFGQNMTTLTFHLARALAAGWGPGDEIIVTELDHQANVAPWGRAARERGATVKLVTMHPATGELDWTALEAAFTRHTRLIAVGAASNALGTITDVGKVRELARAAGALTFVDAVHFAPHELVDVRALGCDFLACSAYKFYGPHIGVLYGRRDRLRTIDVPKLEPAPDTVPERMETGTLNHEGIVGAGAAVDFLASIGGAEGTRRERLVRAFAVLHSRGERLLQLLWNGLSNVPGVTCHGPPPGRPRTPTVAFRVRGHSPQAVTERLAERGIFVSHGDFYATTAVQRIAGREGLVRAGCACYTTESDVDRLVEGVREISV
jgi:cysteine desulfurase family protein (TIGR01976 family)